MKKLLCKAVLNRKNIPPVGSAWIGARRGLLKVDDNSFQMDKEVFPFAEIKSAELQKVPTTVFIPGYHLTLSMQNGSEHHFGFSNSYIWNGDFPFPMRRAIKKLPLLWVRRVLFLSALAYFIFSTLLGRFF